LNATGFIRRHTLDNIEITPPAVQEALNLFFSWPRGTEVPAVAGLSPSARLEAALPFATAELPFATELNFAAAAAETPRPAAARRPVPRPGTTSVHSRAAHTAAAASSARSSKPVMNESPMERAARERSEDAATAARLRALREGRDPDSQARGGGGGGGFGGWETPAWLQQAAPQQCASNYDCERPMVCCDLLVAKICCNSGMMIGPPKQQEKALAPQLIPIPVPVDDGPGNGRGGGGGAYGPGNGFPTPP